MKSQYNRKEGFFWATHARLTCPGWSAPRLSDLLSREAEKSRAFVSHEPVCLGGDLVIGGLLVIFSYTTMVTKFRATWCCFLLLTLAVCFLPECLGVREHTKPPFDEPKVHPLSSRSSTNTDDLYFCPGNSNTGKQKLDTLPQLKIEHRIDTKKERDANDVTLVTQLSFERLYMLEGQCAVWSGVISAAVYIALVDGKAVTVELNSNQDPHLTPMSRIREDFEKFHKVTEAKSMCKLDLQLVSQTVESVWLSALYPVNSMRNRAIANARTDVILLLDVDFWPAAELSELMKQPTKYTSLLKAVNGGQAIVLPAFETGDSGDVGVEVAREAVLGGKDAAAMMFWDGRIKPFHTDRYKAGHRATDFRKWLTAAHPYRIRYEEGFEPYVLVARKYVPWTDERFVGYRKNKVVHLLHLSNLGLQFVVHPGAFVVHSPHPRARTWKVTHTTGLWDQLADLYRDVKDRLEANTYIPASMYSCKNHVVGPIIPQINHISEWTEES